MSQLAKGFVRTTILSATFLVLLGAGMGSLGAYLFNDSYSTYRLVQDVWSSGVEARGANVDGEVKTRKFIFDEYKLRVQYRDTSGGSHDVTIEMISVIQGINDKASPVVKYDPQDFNRVSVSWLQELTWGPWLWILVAVGIVVGGAVLAFNAARSAANQLRDAFAVSKGFRVAAAKILSMKQREHQGKQLPYIDIAFSLPPDNKSTTRVVKDGQPITEDDSLLVLLSDDGRVVVPRHDFYPLEIPAHVSQQLVLQFRNLMRS